mmetsp:Transcript_17922/g.45841  ORF Transcript_17922/g.45841 Transcript_17922/m.45841 type:complete len:131 (-) Transcript_17922:540-932(-)
MLLGSFWWLLEAHPNLWRGSRRQPTTISFDDPCISMPRGDSFLTQANLNVKGPEKGLGCTLNVRVPPGAIIIEDDNTVICNLGPPSLQVGNQRIVSVQTIDEGHINAAVLKDGRGCQREVVKDVSTATKA